MLTPVFELSQDEKSVTVTIDAPSTRLQDSEVTISGNIFYFTSHPYFLRLHFPHPLQDSEIDGACRASFDCESHSFIIVCLKQNPGLHFTGLDMLTSLLTPKTAVNNKPVIELLSSSTASSEGQATEKEEESEELVNFDEDWYEPQELPSSFVLTDGQKYGFADAHSNVPALNERLYDVLQLPDPQHSSPEERRRLRHMDESTRFTSEHYLADLFEDYVSQSYLQFQPYFYSTKSKDKVKYDKQEKVALLQLPRKELLVNAGRTEAQKVAVGETKILSGLSFTGASAGFSLLSLMQQRNSETESVVSKDTTDESEVAVVVEKEEATEANEEETPEDEQQEPMQISPVKPHTILEPYNKTYKFFVDEGDAEVEENLRWVYKEISQSQISKFQEERLEIIKLYTYRDRRATEESRKELHTRDSQGHWDEGNKDYVESSPQKSGAALATDNMKTVTQCVVPTGNTAMDAVTYRKDKNKRRRAEFGGRGGRSHGGRGGRGGRDGGGGVKRRRS